MMIFIIAPFRVLAAALTLCLLLPPAVVVLATPTSSTLQACSEIAALLPPKQVYHPQQDLIQYNQERQSYWSTALRSVRPACIVVPQSAEHVSAAVRVLGRFPGVDFAVRSGGHDPNVGHATVDDGVLIAMTDMAGARYDAASGLAYVKPGGEWNDVIGDLAPSGVTVVGGRLGLVGVGGYLLQGGISFLSAQYGLAADSIVGWETVVANGSIINIDAAQHPDIAVAMRGSGSQFGIVTEFKVRPHPIGKVWGGVRVYSAAMDDDLYAALHGFVSAGAADPKAAVIHSTIIAPAGVEVHFIFYFYDGPEPPSEGPFAEYLKIPALLDATWTRTYADLLKSNGESARLLNARVSFRTYTIPFIPSNPSIYTAIRDKYTELASPLRASAQFSVDFQPLPSIVGASSDAAGGNAMGLRGSDPDRLILEFQGSWTTSLDDAKGYAVSRAMTEWLDEMVPVWLAEERYLPLFMNDAAGDQNVTGSYRDYARFSELQRGMDPRGMFARRLGGFKY
ncbi:FAD binding domain-containing protein [Microdochium trichocladiopsis]|uniref:FAD binding domain-containing protein n=1 Tax=Microdochium trichocladiopsis TaxID=1682393 RepID=A0A9P9BRD3_9PEZI|nr:FAD binding domain-containing protein [Microdochium trichocladiopsis]KAH7032680.1 FAD binding domain-containing protein [Microdochium trichocladiopsis]